MTGMDRRIETPRWSRRRLLTIGIALAAVIVACYVGFASSGTRSAVAPERLGVSEVKQGEFREYVPVTATVQPSSSVYLDLEEGGIVEHIYMQPGALVKQGDLILSFSNNAAQKQNIETETRLLENMNELRNSRFTLARSSLMLQQDLLDVDHQIAELQKTNARYEKLIKGPNAALSREQFETTRDNLDYLRRKRDLLRQRIEREAELQQQQEAQIESSMERVVRNLELLSRINRSLEVHAPVDGILSTFIAELGQSFQRGERIGQIDQLNDFKVQADIDQYYISSVVLGQRSAFHFDGQRCELQVIKIYPEVTDQSFKADMAFIGEAPTGLKRGQKLHLQLGLSEMRRATIVEKGEFVRATGGRWVYVLATDGRSARRTPVVLGQQNPQFVEVLDGLQEGDWILTSNYDSFRGVEQIQLPNAPPAFKPRRSQ